MLRKLWTNCWRTSLIMALIIVGAMGTLKLFPLNQRVNVVNGSKVPRRNFDPRTCKDTTLLAAEVCPVDVMSQQPENGIGVYFVDRPPANTPLNKRFFTFVLVNHSSHDVEYSGYVPESFDPQMPIGEIAPLYSRSILESGEWKLIESSWCGFGSAEMQLKAGRAGRLKAYLPGRTRLGKIGVHCSEINADGNSQKFTVWSEPIEIDPVETP